MIFTIAVTTGLGCKKKKRKKGEVCSLRHSLDLNVQETDNFCLIPRDIITSCSCPHGNKPYPSLLYSLHNAYAPHPKPLLYIALFLKYSWMSKLFFIVSNKEIICQSFSFKSVGLRVFQRLKKNNISLSVFYCFKLKIPHTGDKASLDRCG